ncbi:AbiJ-NTD4 domain-containing protein [Candidatus Spongiihabitans sp.]|uniref:AbiJ-NTD4 domain-containing protein n=1 Tax=Candidatus Spongiihabitans sp. TaxID=3101308 RepID=UPI003C7D76FE
MNEDKRQPFSVRHGYKQSKGIQLESMDKDLRIGLWNALIDCFTTTVNPLLAGLELLKQSHPIFKNIWTKFLKWPLDEYVEHHKIDRCYGKIKGAFLHESWNKMLDLTEFVIHYGYPETEDFIEQCNIVLEEENSAYKIVGKFVTEITSQEEIESIETAMATPFANANEHIGNALSLLSRRENPDYANSIKESISAVESIAKEITGKKSKSLNALTQGLNLPPALKAGLDALYNWTSVEGGIRHGASGEQLAPNKNTARFMLIICSAFVNYLTAENPKNP